MGRVIALGFFDGVHLGHAALLRAARTRADELGCVCAALTFDRSPGKDVRLLTTVEDRTLLMKQRCGVDEVICLRFDDVRGVPWDAFVRSLQADRDAVHLVCGWDYRFGRGAEGSAERLQSLCAALGLGCEIVPRQELGGITISSSHVRALVEAGDVQTARLFLGHACFLSGVVRRGARLGSRLGFPTANLVPAPELVLPRFGVYAALAVTEQGTFRAVCNVGTRPTVGGEGVTVESWLPEFDGDLYGTSLRVEFCSFLRPERKFAGIEALRAQIERDRAEMLRCFAE